MALFVEYICNLFMLGSKFCISMMTTYSILLFVDPDYLVEPSIAKKDHFVGDNITIVGCVVKSLFNSGISMSWMKDGNTLKENVSITSVWKENHFQLSIDSLALVQVTSRDAGMYHCRLDYNQNVTRSTGVKLDIRSKLIRFH